MASHYFLHCPCFYSMIYSLDNIDEIDSTLFNKSDSVVTRILLYDNEPFKDKVNLLILNATNDFVLSTNRFDEPLYLLWIQGCFSFHSYFHGPNFKVVKVVIFTFSYYFFCIPGTHKSHGARWLLFLCLMCKCSFLQKKKLLKLTDSYQNWLKFSNYNSLYRLYMDKNINSNSCFLCQEIRTQN